MKNIIKIWDKNIICTFHPGKAHAPPRLVKTRIRQRRSHGQRLVLTSLCPWLRLYNKNINADNKYKENVVIKTSIIFIVCWHQFSTEDSPFLEQCKTHNIKELDL